MDKLKNVGLVVLKVITSKPVIITIAMGVVSAIGLKVAPEQVDKIATMLASLADLVTGPDVVPTDSVVTE